MASSTDLITIGEIKALLTEGVPDIIKASTIGTGSITASDDAVTINEIVLPSGTTPTIGSKELPFNEVHANKVYGAVFN